MPGDERPDRRLPRRGKKKLAGPTRAWHLVADRLKKSVGEAKASVTSTEFLRWIKLIEDEPNAFNPLHWYLAQIAYEVYLCRMSWTGTGGEPLKVLKDFVLEFLRPAGGDPDEVEDPRSDEAEAASVEAIREHAERSQRAWFAALGIVLDKDGKTVKKKKPPATGSGAPAPAAPPKKPHPPTRKRI